MMEPTVMGRETAMGSCKNSTFNEIKQLLIEVSVTAIQVEMWHYTVTGRYSVL